MEFFPITVKPGEPFTVDLEDTVLWLKSCCLSPDAEGKFLLQVKTKNPMRAAEDEKYENAPLTDNNLHPPTTVAVLDSESRPMAQMDLKIDSEETMFVMKRVGKNGKGSSSEGQKPEVTIICNRQAFAKEEEGDLEAESEEEEEEDSESDEDTVPQLVDVKKGAESSSKKRQAEKIVKTEAGSKKAKIAEEEKKQAEAKKLLEQKEEEKKKQELIQKKKVEKKQQEIQKKKEEEKKKEIQKKKDEETKNQEKSKSAEKQKPLDKHPIKRVLEGGLRAEIYHKSDSKHFAKRGRTVKVRYDGRLASNGKRFDKGSIDFKLGVGQVIKGWDVGVADMAVGEKRKLFIPAKMGYGARGAPPSIPRNADLVFDVELLSVR